MTKLKGKNFLVFFMVLVLASTLGTALLPARTVEANGGGQTLNVANWSNPVNTGVTGRETVLKVGDTYHIWYSPSDTVIYHTSSTNPASFTAAESACTFPTDNTPIEVGSVSVVYENNTFYMIAYGVDNTEFAYYTSTDGTAWTKGGVVFDGTDKFTDFGKVDAPFLFKLDSGYRLYFQVKNADGTRYDIYAAESSTISGTYALVNSGDPVLSPATDSNAWDGAFVMHPWVVKDGDVYYMWYSAHKGGTSLQQIGMAKSTDGLTWVRSPGNPILPQADPYFAVGEPSVINDGGTWRMWYLAAGNVIKYLTATGPFEFQSIQAAIDAASAGDTINVAPGTYHENLAGWKDMEITKSLNLIGAGSELTIIELSEGSGLGGKMNGLEIRGTNLDVLIQGITFTKKPGNTYATSYPIRVAETTSTFNKLTFKDVEVAYGEASNVFLGGNGTFTELIVEDSNIHHAGSWGFLSSGTVRKATITNSNFEYNGQKDPSHGNGLDFNGPLSENITISGGSFSYNKHNGLLLMSAKNVLISDVQANYNAGASNGGFGIAIDEWQSKTTNVVIQNSTANNNSFDGISIQPEKADAIDGVAITGCTLSNNGRNGLNLNYINSGSNNPEMHNISIHTSTITGNGSYGVQVWSWWEPMVITEVFDATNNWWGDVSGPSGVGHGTGDAVSANVTYSPWLDAPAPGGQPISFEEGSIVQETTETGTDTVDAKTEANTEVIKSGSGTPIVTVAQYSDNPGTDLTGGIGKYIDVHIDDATGVTELVIRLYYTDEEITGLEESTLKMLWWDGEEWKPCTFYGVDTTDVDGYSGYIWARITSSSQPSLSDLSGVLAGTPFTAQGEQPPPPIGGEAFPPNKLLLLAPWMALLAVIIAGAVIFVRRRQAKS